MTNLQEMIVVWDITVPEPGVFPSAPRQMKLYPEHITSGAEEGWPANVEELPDVHKEYSNWKLSKVVKMTPVYGRREV